MTEIPSGHLKSLILKAIDVYNRYRSPEATATFVSIEKARIVIDFEGSFCLSCGVRDFFEDFIYELKMINNQLKIELTEINPVGSQSFRVYYKLIGVFPVADDDDSFFNEFLSERGLTFKDYIESNSCTRDVLMFHFRTWLFERKHQTKK